MLMNFFLFIFLALLALVTIGLLVVFYYLRKGIRFFRRFSTGDMSEDEFMRMSNKYYRKMQGDGEQFDSDYFKGSGWQKGQSGQSGQSGQQPGGQPRQRTTHTAGGGITIEDRRDPGKANKKIFAHDEGEYVDFTEN